MHIYVHGNTHSIGWKSKRRKKEIIKDRRKKKEWQNTPISHTHTLPLPKQPLLELLFALTQTARTCGNGAAPAFAWKSFFIPFPSLSPRTLFMNQSMKILSASDAKISNRIWWLDSQDRGVTLDTNGRQKKRRIDAI